MFTRCDSCQALYELDAAALAEAAGIVRCGNCGRTFNSLAHLHARRPDANEEPLRGGGMPPLLEHPELVQGELPVVVDEPGGARESDTEQAVPAMAAVDSRFRLAWPITCIVLALALLIQTWMLARTPGSPLARWIGGADAAAVTDPNEVFAVVSRDMHPHPSLDDAVIVSVALRNQATNVQHFPIIEIRFYDQSQQLLGARRLLPQDYLHDQSLLERGLGPGTVVPLLLEFVLGTTEPAGFQLRIF